MWTWTFTSKNRTWTWTCALIAMLKAAHRWKHRRWFRPEPLWVSSLRKSKFPNDHQMIRKSLCSTVSAAKMHPETTDTRKAQACQNQFHASHKRTTAAATLTLSTAESGISCSGYEQASVWLFHTKSSPANCTQLECCFIHLPLSTICPSIVVLASSLYLQTHQWTKTRGSATRLITHYTQPVRWL